MNDSPPCVLFSPPSLLFPGFFNPLTNVRCVSKSSKLPLLHNPTQPPPNYFHLTIAFFEILPVGVAHTSRVSSLPLCSLLVFLHFVLTQRSSSCLVFASSLPPGGLFSSDHMHRASYLCFYVTYIECFNGGLCNYRSPFTSFSFLSTLPSPAVYLPHKSQSRTENGLEWTALFIHALTFSHFSRITSTLFAPC